MKVIGVDMSTSFNHIGIEIVRAINGKGYAIVSNKYQYAEPIFVGSKNQCLHYIASL
jgi:hypothetical protein